jgi:VanZ family protein
MPCSASGGDLSGLTLHSPEPNPPNRRTYAVLALGAAAFIVYGSLVPLDFRARPLDEVLKAYRWAMTERVLIQSRADAITNFLVAVPLGFALLAMTRVDQDTDRRRDFLAAIQWLPACVALGAAVEFAQLYVPTRTCSASDVICQGFGAGVGMVAWILFGRELNAGARQLWGRSPGSGAAARLLLLYLLLLAVIQTLPFDLNPGPKELYRKVRDEVQFVPFEEFRQGDDAAWDAAARSIRVIGLFLPLGLLAARLKGGIGRNFFGLLGFAIGTAVIAEALQVAIQSRHPAATDAVVAFGGIVAGWLLGRVFANGLSVEAALILGQVWVAALMIDFWQPFHERMPRGDFDWLPGAPADSGNPLLTLLEFLCKLVFFAPFGILTAAAASRLRVGVMLGLAALIGAAVAAVLEIGQLFVGAHTPGITDVILGGCGAAAGAWIASRVV